MFFLKPKHKFDEVLPPPPPETEFEDESEESGFFEETTKPEEATETLPEEKEFDDLTKDLGIELEPQKGVSKKEKTIQKAKTTKEQKIPKKIELKKPISIKTTKKGNLPLKKTIPVKQIKKGKILLKNPIKTVKKEAKKIGVPKSKEKPDISKEINLTKAKIFPEDKEFEDLFKEVKALKPKEVKEEKLEDLDFILPKELKETSEKEIELLHELEKPEEIELPETLEDLGIEDFEKDLKQETKTKPKEILEAEDEIKSAIEKIKNQEKPSLFKRLFSKKKKIDEKPKENLMPQFPETDEVSIIQNNIHKIRESLMKFDLDAAKINYVEVMKIYNNLKPEEQAKVYHDIKDLYFERKSAEGLKA